MRLFVVGLDSSITSHQLENLFSAYGRVMNAKVIRDHETQVSRGFGFVTMETEGDGKLAMRKLNGQEIEGRTITVKKAREKAPQEPKTAVYHNWKEREKAEFKDYS